MFLINIFTTFVVTAVVPFRLNVHATLIFVVVTIIFVIFVTLMEPAMVSKTFASVISGYIILLVVFAFFSSSK